jgi:hypothetical protein
MRTSWHGLSPLTRAEAAEASARQPREQEGNTARSLNFQPIRSAKDLMSVTRQHGNLQSTCPTRSGNMTALPVSLGCPTQDQFDLTIDRHSYYRYSNEATAPGLVCRPSSIAPASSLLPDLPRFLTLGSGVAVGGSPEGAGPVARAFTLLQSGERSLEICPIPRTTITFPPGGMG